MSTQLNSTKVNKIKMPFGKKSTKKATLPTSEQLGPVPPPRPPVSNVPRFEDMSPAVKVRTTSSESSGSNTGRKQSDGAESKVNAHNEIRQLSYYHPEIKEVSQIKNVMAKYSGRSGHFLLRDSKSKPGTYTITVMHTTGIKHINIDSTSSTFYLKDMHFPSLHDLIEHYDSVSVPNQENVSSVFLRYPIHQDFVDHARTGLVGAAYNSNDENSAQAYLTQTTEPTSKPIGQIAQKTKPSIELDLNYTQATRGSFPMAHTLIKHIITTEQSAPNSDRCECGLLLDDSQLPRGWSVHVSRDSATNGRIFFLSAEGETRWELPMWIAVDLTPDQQDRLRDLLRMSDNHLTSVLNSHRSHPAASVSGPVGPRKISETSNYVSHDTQNGANLSTSTPLSPEIYTKIDGEHGLYGNFDYAGLKEPPKDRILLANNNEKTISNAELKNTPIARTQAAVSYSSSTAGPSGPQTSVRRSETLPPLPIRKQPHYMPMTRAKLV